jgi:hypothetical protein
LRSARRPGLGVGGLCVRTPGRRTPTRSMTCRGSSRAAGWILTRAFCRPRAFAVPGGEGRGGGGDRFTHAVRALRRRSARSETWFRSRAAGPVAPTLFTLDSAPPRRRDFPRLAHGARLYRDAADRWSALQGGEPCPTDLARRRLRFDALTRDYRADAQDAERERVRVRASQRATRDGEAAGRFAETRCHEC